jgi:hypothetical protein
MHWAKSLSNMPLLKIDLMISILVETVDQLLHQDLHCTANHPPSTEPLHTFCTTLMLRQTVQPLSDLRPPSVQGGRQNSVQPSVQPSLSNPICPTLSVQPNLSNPICRTQSVEPSQVRSGQVKSTEHSNRVKSTEHSNRVKSTEHSNRPGTI